MADITPGSRRARLRRLAALGLAGVALVSAGQFLAETARRARQVAGQPDRVTRDVTRLEPLRALLPAHGTIGYLSDRGGREHYLAQYTLAPRMVVASADPELVVADFRDRRALAAAAAAAGLEILHDLGGGVAVLRRPP
jgi:hypothetical protein